MSERNDKTQIGGTISHVGDCYIWAEIFYLDSATDYREYLMPRIQDPRLLSGNELVMLDDVTPSPLWVVLRNLAGGAVSILHAVDNVARLCFRIQN